MKLPHVGSVAVLASLALTGCMSSVEGDEGALGTASSEDETFNSLTVNSLTVNSLTVNSLTVNSLMATALTSTALLGNTLTASALEDPASRSVLKYIVGCALDAGQELDVTVDGTLYSYPGELGLAPAWGKQGGHCDANCAGLVSSCVLARVNYLGVMVPISERGPHPLTAGPAEKIAYPHIDGVYYGNIFTSPQIRLACLPPGVTQLTRVCGPSLVGCVVDVVGACADVCDGVRGDGSFPNCRDMPRSAHGAITYNQAVTVFLQ